jgi:tetratricopeptide (TPR) repeat protein
MSLIPPVPQTGQTPPDLNDPALRALLRRPHPDDERDLFASDPDPLVRDLGKLVLRRAESFDVPGDLLALADACIRMACTPDGRLRVFYIGKALLALRRSAAAALSRGQAKETDAARRAADAFIGWLIAAALVQPSRRNLAAALWAVSEYDEALTALPSPLMATSSDALTMDDLFDPSAPMLSGSFESESTAYGEFTLLPDADGELRRAAVQPQRYFSEHGAQIIAVYLPDRTLDQAISELLARFRDPSGAADRAASTFGGDTKAETREVPRPAVDLTAPATIEGSFESISDADIASIEQSDDSDDAEQEMLSETRLEVGIPEWSAPSVESDAEISEVEDDAGRDSAGRQRQATPPSMPSSGADSADHAADDLSDEFAVGSLLDGRYEVINVRKGGMGVVYLCYDHQRREPVAIKSFQSRFFNNPRAQARFKREAETWILMEKHRHVVHARLVQPFEGRPHLILEHVSGPEGLEADLRSWIERGHLTPPLAIKFGLHIALGMQHAAQKVPGLVHRDLKPANILVTHDEIAKVTDFGLVRSVEDDLPAGSAGGAHNGDDSRSGSSTEADERLTRFGALVGTLPYMSPEQCQAQPVDQRSDIYAFGCLLYEMLTGSHVFPVRKREAWLHAHIHEIPAFPPEFESKLPESIRALVLKCLEKQPDQRLANWGAIVETLAAIYEAELGEAPELEISGIELEARELMDKAYSLTELGRAEEALTTYDRAIALQPNFPWAWARKGRALRILNRCEEALACYDEALRLDPNYAWALKGRGMALERMGDLEGALEAHRRAAQLDPNDVWHWHNQGEIYQKMGRYDEAIALLEAALRVDERHSNSWAKLGQIYRLKRQYDRAMEAYERAIALDRRYAWAHNGCGLTLKARGEYEKALLSFRRAARYEPRVVWHWYNVTEMLVELGQYEEALPPVREAVRLNPNHVQAWAKLGQVLRYLKRYEDALIAYERAVALQPNFAWAHNGMGIIYEQMGRYEDALACYQLAAQHDNLDASHWYNQGNALALLGRMADALPLLERAVELKPDFSRAWARLGGALRSLGRLEEAVTALRAATDRDPANAWAWSELSKALSALGRAAESEDAQRRAAESKPDHAIYLTQHADALFNRGAISEALTLLDQAIRLDPRSARAWARRGQVLRRLDRNLDALRSYERALDLDPRYAWAWAGRAMAELELKLVNEALESFQRAIDLDPDDMWYRYTLGDTLVAHNRFQDAAQVLAAATQIDPTHPDVWAKLGQAYRRLRRYDDALHAYDKSLALKADHAWAWHGRGMTLEALRRRDEALSSYRRALELDQAVIWYYTNFVDLLLAEQQYDEALLVIDGALRALPENPIAWARHGQVLRRMGAYDGAIASYHRALDLDPTYAWAWNGLGMARAALGQWQDALEAYREAVRFNPNDPWFWYNFGDALLAVGERKSAAAMFEQALSLDPRHEAAIKKLRAIQDEQDASESED